MLPGSYFILSAKQAATTTIFKVINLTCRWKKCKIQQDSSKIIVGFAMHHKMNCIVQLTVPEKQNE